MPKLRTACCLVLVCLAYLTALAAQPVQERDWTFKTPWGDVGFYQLSYCASGEATADTPAGFVQVCGGPLGNVSVEIDSARRAGSWRAAAPVLFALGTLAVVLRTHWQDRKT